VFLLFNNSKNLRKISVNNLAVKYRQNEDNAGVARRKFITRIRWNLPPLEWKYQ
jgi:hypothetical protein